MQAFSTILKKEDGCMVIFPLAVMMDMKQSKTMSNGTMVMMDGKVKHMEMKTKMK